MRPDTPTVPAADRLVELAVTAAGPYEGNAPTYAARVMEALAVIADLGVFDLAEQVIGAAKGADSAGFLNGTLVAVEYHERSQRGWLWIKPAMSRDADMDKANSPKDDNWKLHNGVPVERFKTERTFTLQGQAMWERAQALVGHNITFAKVYYTGGDSNRHREIVGLIDLGAGKSTGKGKGSGGGPPQAPPPDDPGPAPAPKAKPAPKAAAKAAPKPAAKAAPKAKPAAKAEPAPEPELDVEATSLWPQAVEFDNTAAGRTRQDKFDALNPGYSDRHNPFEPDWAPSDMDELFWACVVTGIDPDKAVALFLEGRERDGRDPKPEVLWVTLRDALIAAQDAELAAAAG